ncbi:MAG: heme-binding protein [Gammaproteobacteria bacterium]|nr:heme-binding protein [Gammaproteobacteria bacterium]
MPNRSNARCDSCQKAVRCGRLILLMCAASAAAAEGLVTTSHVSLEFAQKAVAEALRQCRADGYRVSVTVTDAAGLAIVTARADGAGPHTLDSSRRKAYTAASLQQPTQNLAELAGTSAALAGLHQMNDSILLLGGGFPIRINGIVVGAIGVGGAPGARLDETCARAGLQAIGADAYDVAR